jgi:integrase
MSLVKRGNSRFWYVQFQLEHQTFVRSTKTTDRRVAEQVALKIRAEAHAELVLGKKKALSLDAALRRYIDGKAGTSNHRNLVSLRRIILQAIAGSTPISRITESALEDFRRRRTAEGCAPQTIKHGLNCLLGALRMARKSGFDVSDVAGPQIKLLHGRLRYLSIDEERRLLAELDPQREGKGLASYDLRSPAQRQVMQDNFDLVVLLLDTGARYSEIANIRWNSIDLIRRSIRLWRPKVRNESVLLMTDRVFEVLSRRSKTRASEFVFCSKSGGPRGYSPIAIKKAMCRAELSDCTVHTLRHTHATRLIQNGLSLYEVQAMLGHTDIRTTMRYAHLEYSESVPKLLMSFARCA